MNWKGLLRRVFEDKSAETTGEAKPDASVRAIVPATGLNLVPGQADSRRFPDFSFLYRPETTATTGAANGTSRLSPESLNEFVGQQQALERLLLACECARRESRALDSVFIAGPTGTGKTTLSLLLARAWRSRPTLCRAASDYGPDNLKRDAILLTARSAHHPMLILDELHAASSRLRASLLVFMDQPTGVTVVGLTNKSIEAALLRRFPLQLDLTFWSEVDMLRVIQNYAERSQIGCMAAAARILARVSFTPGQASTYFLESRNRAVASGRPIDEFVVQETLEAMGVDTATGLDEKQLAALQYIYQAGRASARSVSIALGIDEAAYQTTEEVLVRRGLVTITSRGRAVTARAVPLLQNPRSVHDDQESPDPNSE